MLKKEQKLASVRI